jgi:hypothetical protein
MKRKRGGILSWFLKMINEMRRIIRVKLCLEEESQSSYCKYIGEIVIVVVSVIVVVVSVVVIITWSWVGFIAWFNWSIGTVEPLSNASVGSGVHIV